VEEEKSELARLVNKQIFRKSIFFKYIYFSHVLLEQWQLGILLKLHLVQRAW
jgi:hypothetical protein